MSADVLTRNNVTVYGQGTQPMMFAHGFGCDQTMWRFITPAFEEQYRIVLFDYVGSGKSELAAYNKERYSDLEGYAEDVLEICEALDLHNVILVGHSVSSIIGVLAANREPERFDRLIFVVPSPRYINDPPAYVGGFQREEIEELLHTMEKNYVGWANFLAPIIMQNGDRPELTDELAGSFCATDPEMARQFAQATFLSDNREDLPRLRVPSLIIQCADDVIAPMPVGEYMHEHTPNSTLRVLPVTGHCPHMSHPDETIAAMKEYLGVNGQL